MKSDSQGNTTKVPSIWQTHNKVPREFYSQQHLPQLSHFINNEMDSGRYSFQDGPARQYTAKKDAAVTYEKGEIMEIQMRMCVLGAGLDSETLQNIWEIWMYVHMCTHTSAKQYKLEFYCLIQYREPVLEL